MRSISFAMVVALATAQDLTEVEFAQEFEAFQRDFGKVYSDEERDVRYEAFKANLRIIRESNARNGALVLGLNAFSDLRHEEFAATHLGLRSSEDPRSMLSRLGEHAYSGLPLPAAVDWVDNGAVTPVKDQKSCGSCWAFSTVGALEGAWQLGSGKLVSLSEQQFVDCDKSDDGCGGGLMDSAFDYAKQTAICTESSYAYTARSGSCRASSCAAGMPSGAVTGYKDVTKNDMNALMEAVSQQPVSVGVDASGYYWQHYKSGVLVMPCGDNLDHGVLLVGYGTDNGQDYWKVKNSWGASWGESGYIRLGRGGASPPWGECGVQGQASYPVVSGQPTLSV